MTTKLAKGIDVDIQRTNGRIHSAVVSSIDWVAKSVTVEWSEANEIKGKEIDFESLFALNPHLDQNTVNATIQSLSSVTSTVSAKKAIPTPKPSVSSHAPTQNIGSAGGVKGSLRIRTTAVNGNASANTNLRRETMANGNGAPLAETTNGVSSRVSNMASSALGIAARNSSSDAGRRRSNVVKEVDKIKKQREERRERQAQQQKDKQELMANVEPGNQNWEFLGMIRDYRASLEFRPLACDDKVDVHQICVAVRKRPMNKKELAKKDIDVVTIPTKDMLIVHEPKTKVDLTRYLENHCFRFDYAFDETVDNEMVYRYTAKPLVQTIFEGGMATCFAYGQTGSGKTHTMGGDFQGGKAGVQDSSKGIYGLVAKDVFKLLKSPKFRNDDLIVVASFFEIYSGKVFDLLNNKQKLRVLEDARNQVQVVGLQERQVESVDDVFKLIHMGTVIRTSGQTSANNHSSRSHAVFQLQLKGRRPPHHMRGKFSLIDLAGNERGADTSSADRTVRMEGAEINKSLLALKECIRALGRKGTHTPFRASKLTQVLRDSFIGENSRTCMIAMISPGMMSCEHSLNTLRYADRVKELGAESPEMVMKPVGEDDGVEDMQCEDDLAILQHSNSAELNEDFYTLHNVISHVQEVEDEVLETHKVLVENTQRWNTTSNQLLQMASLVDYDVEKYAERMESLLEEVNAFNQGFLSKVKNLRAQLAEEEQMSKNIVGKRKK